MLLSDMEALGIRKLFPTGDLGFVLGYMPNLVPKREKIPDLTMEEVQVAKRVAAGFGVEFAVMSRGIGRGVVLRERGKR